MAARDVGGREVPRVWLLDLVDHLASRLRQAGLHAGPVEVKVRSPDFRTRTRSQALAEVTDRTNVLWQAAAALLERSLTGDMLPARLLGVGASRLAREGSVQGHLIDAELRERQTALDRAVEAIRGQLGTGAIRRDPRLVVVSPCPPSSLFSEGRWLGREAGSTGVQAMTLVKVRIDC